MKLTVDPALNMCVLDKGSTQASHFGFWPIHCSVKQYLDDIISKALVCSFLKDSDAVRVCPRKCCRGKFYLFIKFFSDGKQVEVPT